jgi:hypothetical protein
MPYIFTVLDNSFHLTYHKHMKNKAAGEGTGGADKT